MRSVRRVASLRSAVIAAALFAFVSGARYAPNLRHSLSRFSSTYAPSPAIPRKIYPYSVVPGGVYSPDELSLARRVDSVVARHYADFKSSATLGSLPKGALMYVSYRKGDRVYWTKVKHRIPKGEPVICDGENYARARCGNRLSFKPLAPILPGKEPTEEALNIPAPPPNPALLKPSQLPAAPDVDFFVPAAPTEDTPAPGPYVLQTTRTSGPTPGGAEAPYQFGPVRGAGPFLGNSLYYPQSNAGQTSNTPVTGPSNSSVTEAEVETPEPESLRLLLLAVFITLFFGMKRHKTEISFRR